jgi:hypothetical protein
MHGEDMSQSATAKRFATLFAFKVILQYFLKNYNIKNERLFDVRFYFILISHFSQKESK